MTPTKRCFVISPIGDEGSEIRDHADDVFEFIIKPALKGTGIKPVRSDHMSETGRITEQMFREILHADLCVAVLTGYNANVFYELAVAQCAARPIIVLIEEGHELPFDVKDLRAIDYSLQPISRVVREKVYARRMRAQIDQILNNGMSAKGLFEEFDFPELHDEQQLRHMIQSAAPTPLDSGQGKRYALPSGQQIVILTGDLKELLDVRVGNGGSGPPGDDSKIDVIVSLENTFLQLARYFDASISGSVSGMLRYLDAEKSDTGEILADSLRDNLQREIQGRKLPVRLGSVIATPTTGLRKAGVKYVFHVAAMQGSVGDGYKTMDDVLDDCVRNAYNRFARLHAEEKGLETILFPMLGAATTTLEPHDVARELLKNIVAKMKSLPACRTTYLLAWLESHRYAVQQVAREMGLEELEETAEAA